MSKGQTKGASTEIAKKIGDLGLSDNQAQAVLLYLNGSTKSEAASLLGYSPSSGAALFRSVKVQAAVAAAVDRFLVGELAPAAIHTISRLLADDKTPAGTKAQLALGVLDRSGYSAKRFEKADGAGKDASAMSTSELQAEIDRLSREIEAKMVDVTPVSEPLTDEDLELYA